MKFGFPFTRETEEEFAYCMLPSQHSARLSLLAPFRNNNRQNQALGGKKNAGLPGRRTKKCLSSQMAHGTDFFLSFPFLHRCTAEYGKQTNK